MFHVAMHVRIFPDDASTNLFANDICNIVEVELHKSLSGSVDRV